MSDVSEPRSWVRMRVLALSVDPMSNLPIVVLADETGRHLPIPIGLGEAAAIAAELEAIVLERPMTHQLCCELLHRVGASVTRVELGWGDGEEEDAAAEDGSVLAHVIVITAAETIRAVARPSDAIALGLRSRADLWVSPEVLRRAAHLDPEGGAREFGLAGLELVPLVGGATDHGAEVLAALDAGAFGKWKM